MTELETMERAKMYMEKLANGINPIDDSVIPDEDVVNNVRLSRCFFYVADVLRQVIDNGGISAKTKTKKQRFNLPVEKRSEFAFSNEPITISEIVKRINQLNEGEDMSKLKHTEITDWLLSVGLLQNELNAEGKVTKRPTPQGESVGIALESRTGMNGTYFVVVYNLAAQHFILDNIDAVIDVSNAKYENQWQPWSEEHDRCLRELYLKKAPISEIAITLKRNNSAVRARIKKLGIAE